MATFAGKKNHLFLVPIRVKPGPAGKWPVEWIGALVPCYAAAPDHFDAVRISLEKLEAAGYVFEELMNDEVHEIDASRWNEHLAAVWLEQSDHLPSQTDLLRFVQSGGVFFGPICGWESDT